MNIDIDLMLTITAGIILSQIISYGFSFFFSSGTRTGSAAKGGAGNLKEYDFKRPDSSRISVESLDKAFNDINNSETK